MRAYQFTQEGTLGRLAAKLAPQQLELPFAQATKDVAQQVAKPKRVEYWGTLPGESPQSRPFFRKQFNSEEEAQEFIRRTNATPMGSKVID